MARQFVTASAQQISFGDIPDYAAPLTVACWFKLDATGIVHSLVSRWGGGPGAWALYALDTNHFLSVVDPLTVAITGTATLTTGVWYHGLAQWDGTDAKIFLQGAQDATTPYSSTIATTDRPLMVGAEGDGTRSTCRIGDVAIWNVILTADEKTALAKGVSAFRIRRDNLKHFPPLGYGSPEPDLANSAYTGTLTNTPALVDHPPVSMPFGYDDAYVVSIPGQVPLRRDRQLVAYRGY